MDTESKDPRHVNFRTTPDGAVWLDEMTAKHEVTRTILVRSALRVAARHPDELADIIALTK